MTDIIETIKEFIIGIITKIVDHPNEVEIIVSNTTKSILIQIKVSKSDIGQVIGRNGRTISAITLITTAVKNTQFIGDKKDVFIEIIEDQKTDFYIKNRNKI